MVTRRDEHQSLYLSYLKRCNDHDFDGMASFYTSTVKVNDVPMIQPPLRRNSRL